MVVVVVLMLTSTVFPLSPIDTWHHLARLDWVERGGVYATMSISIAFHEFGHALAAHRRAGLTGSVHLRLSALVIPLVYVRWDDLSRISNRDRLWVSLAGIRYQGATGMGRQTNRRRVRRLFDSRVDGRPRYKLEEVTPSAMTSEAETIRIDEIVAHMESLVFTADAKIDRKHSELLDGVPAIRMDASAIAGTLQLWVDPATGTPLRYTLRASLPLLVSAEIKCEFRSSDVGLGFPARRTHDIRIRIPFKGARLQSEVQFSDWTRQ